jgi:hypothetical protein
MALSLPEEVLENLATIDPVEALKQAWEILLGEDIDLNPEVYNGETWTTDYTLDMQEAGPEGVYDVVVELLRLKLKKHLPMEMQDWKM